MSLFVSVGVEKVPFAVDKLFCYEVPLKLAKQIQVGCLVAVCFGSSNNLRQAIVLKISDSSSENCKFIDRVLSKGSVISIDLLHVVRFLHSTCFCTWFEAVRTVLPSGCFFKVEKFWSFGSNEAIELSEAENDFVINIKQVFEKKSARQFDAFVKQFLDGSLKTIVKSLMNKGLIFKKSYFERRLVNRVHSLDEKVVLNSEIDLEQIKLTSKQKLVIEYVAENGPVFVKKACYDCGVSIVVLKNLERKQLIRFEKDLENSESACELANYAENKFNNNFKLVDEINLNDQQKAAFDGLLVFLKSKESKTALLRGITGSGKTVVFLKLIDFVLKRGEQVILLVPEIALTPQMVDFFKAFFGNLISVLHSGLTLKQQFCEHEKIKSNKTKLIIGTRSAVFAPCVKLGLIIMDEEGELTYKNKDASPRYHTRDVARFRCMQFKALLLLASATPSIETQYFAKIGRYSEFVLTKRFKRAILPKVFVVDLKKAKNSPINGLSLFFYNELIKNLSKKEQTIILLNRRGYNSSVVCLKCGHKMSCLNCSALLTYHSANDSLICHYCGRIQKASKVCDKCFSSNLMYFGQGTQKIEQELALKLQNVKILRLDSDSVYSRVDLENKIKNFEMGYYDILVGTQIVSKGLNFKNVTLVGVVSIDNLLYGSDFRNSEQVFSLLTQVVGRSGRGEKTGRAVIQTFSPQNSTIVKAATQNYEKFYFDEIEERRIFFYPPFCDLCVVNFSGFDSKKVHLCAKEFIVACRNNADVDVPINVLGVATPFIEKLNKRFRKRVIIKCKNGVKFRKWILKVVNDVFSLSIFNGIRTNIDMNGEIL